MLMLDVRNAIAGILDRYACGRGQSGDEVLVPLGEAAAASLLRQVEAAEDRAADADRPVYGWDEIRRHAGGASTWLVIDAEVYDVSSFIEQHPGGAERLREWAGRDASRAFHGAVHGPLTRIFRFNYRIGRVVEPEPKAS